jgi:hypothetical protein
MQETLKIELFTIVLGLSHILTLQFFSGISVQNTCISKYLTVSFPAKVQTCRILLQLFYSLSRQETFAALFH